MKQAFTLLLTLVALNTFAQVPITSGNDTAKVQAAETIMNTPMPPVSGKAAKQEVFRKNIIKINLSSLAFSNYSLSYERSITRKTSLVAGYAFIPKTNVTSIPLVDRAINRFAEDEDDVVEQLRNSTIANKTYTGELRFYTGKKAGARGLYVSLYGRYMNLDATYTHEYEADTRTYDIPIDGNITGFGGGLMLGSQWLIARRVTFDWYILGGHYGKMKLNLNGKTDLSTMSPEERRELEEEIESINDDLPGNTNVDATVTASGVTVKGNAPFAGIRGLGFSLGIAF